MWTSASAASNTLTVPNEAITQFNGQPAVWIAMPMGESGPIQYTCPMHPNVISEKPGCRPKCGMDLVPTKRHGQTSASAETQYTCPMHPEVKSDKPGRFPKCGTDLVPTKRQGSDSKVAQLRLVHLGETDGQRTIVLKGLKEGDEVIVRGWQTLKEGTPVVAVQWGEWGPTEFPAGTLPPLSPPHAGHSQGGSHQRGNR